MSTQTPLFPPPDAEQPDDVLTLGNYAERAYLDYAISVVKGRALPEVADGQKPVQRRILHSMNQLGLALRREAAQKRHGGRRRARQAPSARRPVGLRRAGAHGAGLQPALPAGRRAGQLRLARRRRRGGDALHRSASDADRATAARRDRRGHGRLRPELRRVEHRARAAAGAPAVRAAQRRVRHRRRDGDRDPVAPSAPKSRPRRSRWSARTARRRPPSCSRTSRARTSRAAARSSRRPQDIAAIYESGRGSLKVRARWTIEDLARGQWQVVVNELPPNTSTQKVLEEIEELTNPKIRLGKKALSAEQVATRQTILGALDTVRDESGRERAGAARVRAEVAQRRADGVHPSAARAHQPRVQRRDEPRDDRHRRPAAAEAARRHRARVGRVPADRDPATHAASPRQGRRAHPHPRGPQHRAAEHRRRDPHHPRGRCAEARADRGLRAVGSPGRGHPRDPAAATGAARSHPHRAGARRPARRQGEARGTARATRRR